MVSAIGFTLISAAILTRTIQLSASHQRTHLVGRRVMLASTILIGLLGFSESNIIPLLILLVLLMLAPIFYAFRVWIEMPGTEPKRVSSTH
jgi:hypothetical protein